MLTYLNSNDTLDSAADFLIASGYTAVPVVDDAGKYVGVVSEGDFLRIVMDEGRHNLSKYKVSDIVKLDVDGAVLNTVSKMVIYKPYE